MVQHSQYCVAQNSSVLHGVVQHSKAQCGVQVLTAVGELMSVAIGAVVSVTASVSASVLASATMQYQPQSLLVVAAVVALTTTIGGSSVNSSGNDGTV